MPEITRPLSKEVSMLVAVNAGNTNTVAGLFDREGLVEKKTAPTDELLKGLSLKAMGFDPAHPVAVASVCEGLWDALAGQARASGAPKPLRLPGEIPYPLDLAVRDHAAVGPDRVLNAAMASRLARGSAVAVDFGTAVTVDLAWEGSFQGGAILPGTRMQARALHGFTSRLPDVDPLMVAGPAGKDTEEAISSGVYWGILGAVNGIIRRMEEEQGSPLAVFATGGDAGRFKPHFGETWQLEEDLTLLGIHLAWEKAES